MDGHYHPFPHRVAIVDNACKNSAHHHTLPMLSLFVSAWYSPPCINQALLVAAEEQWDLPALDEKLSQEGLSQDHREIFGNWWKQEKPKVQRLEGTLYGI